MVVISGLPDSQSSADMLIICSLFCFDSVAGLFRSFGPRVQYNSNLGFHKIWHFS